MHYNENNIHSLVDPWGLIIVYSMSIAKIFCKGNKDQTIIGYVVGIPVSLKLLYCLFNTKHS